MNSMYGGVKFIYLFTLDEQDSPVVPSDCSELPS